MEETLRFLKRDRRVNDTFMKKLESVGLEVNYADFSYWRHQPYVEVGRDRVWLVEVEFVNNGNTSMCVWRYQNNVVDDEIVFINHTTYLKRRNYDKITKKDCLRCVYSKKS